MKINKIKEILETFSKNNQRCILIDGPWGIGKTTVVKEFISKNKKDLKKQKTSIVYVSLFGKKSVDEIHTEIYTRLHPKKAVVKNLVGLIPSAVSLFSGVGNIANAISFATQIGENNIDVLKVSSKAMSLLDDTTEDISNIASGAEIVIDKMSKFTPKAIVILDDFERVCDTLEPNELLGYINKLFLEEVKVVVLSCSQEINNPDEFGKFKEKVIDRAYLVQATDDEIIRGYFEKILNGKHALGSEIIKIINNNLRNAQKIARLFGEVVDNCKGLKVEDYDQLLLHIALVVVNDNFITKQGNSNEVKPNMRDDVFTKNLAVSIRENMVGGDSIKLYHINKILEQLNQVDNSEIKKQINEYLLNDILDIYYYDKYDEIEKYYNINSNEYSFLNKNLFYLGEAELKEALLAQAKIFLNPNTDIGSIKKYIEQILVNLFKYRWVAEGLIDYEQIKTRLIELIKDGQYEYEELNRRSWGLECKEYSKFLQEFEIDLKPVRICQVISKIKELVKRQDIDLEVQILNAMNTSLLYTSDKLDEKFLELLKTNEFFLPDLSNTITSQEWKTAGVMCLVASKHNFQSELHDYINVTYANCDVITREKVDTLLTWLIKE
ncbi:MAG: ATP-binding protein [Bacillota bacterium]